MGLVDTVGYLNYSVNVTCPLCQRPLDLNEAPYDDRDELGLAIFGSDIQPAKWIGLNIEYQCNHCKNYFILTRLDID